MPPFPKKSSSNIPHLLSLFIQKRLFIADVLKSIPKIEMSSTSSAPSETSNSTDSARELIETIENPEENYIILMAAFLFLYLYMPKRNPVSRQRLKQRSRIILNYVKKHRLDTQCLESRLYNDSSEKSASLSSRKQSVLARPIIWTYGKDVKCGFQGSGGHLAEYLTAHRERTMAVYEVSRTALGDHWGSGYPECQLMDDDDNAMELEFLWALTTLWQEINDLSLGIAPNNLEVSSSH